MLILFVVFSILFYSGSSLHAQKKSSNGLVGYVPSNGFIPDKITAIRIAIAVWLPIYGNNIYKEKPFIAKVNDDVWTVTGSLPKGSVGGVAEIRIQKKDGKILSVIHGK